MSYATITLGELNEALREAGARSLSVVHYAATPRGTPPWVALVRGEDGATLQQARGLTPGQAIGRLLGALSGEEATDA